MTDELRRRKYGESGVEGMHYARCFGELVLIPDKGNEPYTHSGGMGQLYTGKQMYALHRHLDRIEKGIRLQIMKKELAEVTSW